VGYLASALRTAPGVTPIALRKVVTKCADVENPALFATSATGPCADRCNDIARSIRRRTKYLCGANPFSLTKGAHKVRYAEPGRGSHIEERGRARLLQRHAYQVFHSA
jgi:hypothetical protein